MKGEKSTGFAEGRVLEETNDLERESETGELAHNQALKISAQNQQNRAISVVEGNT